MDNKNDLRFLKPMHWNTQNSKESVPSGRINILKQVEFTKCLQLFLIISRLQFLWHDD